MENSKMKKWIVIIFLMFMLTACIDDSLTGSDRLYVSADVTYSESTAQYAFRLNMDSAETEFAKYFFESSVEDKERETCIETTDTLLASQALNGFVPEIYIFSEERYNHKYITDHKLYSSVQDWTSIEYITDVLMAVYGESAHYGTAFGYANYLAKNQKWGCYDGTFSTPSINDILDLNYLCFDEAFAAHDDIEASKGIACAFVESYISQHGEIAFQQLLSSHTKAIEALEAYYNENGVSYTLSEVRYGYGGKSYDYIVYSDFATFYIAKDWVDIHAELNPLITDGFLHTDYSNTKAFFETNLKQMKQYQDLFKLDNYNNDLEIIFSKPLNISQSSFYQSVIHRIYLYNVDSLMHEYIHSLAKTASSMPSWKVEGFARYFSYYYDFYGMAFLNQDYNNTPDTPELKYIHEYLAAINRPIDIAKDYQDLENIAVYSRSFTDPNKNYLTGSSFIQYLVKQYGEEAVISSIYGNGDSLPKTFRELVKDWNEYIETTYQNYSKYE